MDTIWITIFFISTLIYCLNGQTYRQCYKCDGADCITEDGFEVVDCTIATDQCVTIYEGFTPVKRACYDALDATEKASCDNTANVECSKCDADNCNDLGRTDHTCIDCSSIKNRTCITSPTTYTATRCIAPLYSGSPACYIKTDGETTQRGCIITELELNSCITNATNECSYCTTPGCNNYEFPVGRRKCYRGTILEYCDNASDNCFAYNIYGAKQLCSSEVEDSIREVCENSPNRCVECLDDGCNTNFIFNIQCRECDSSSTDKNCVGTPNQSTLDNCTDGCVTYIQNEAGSLATTHRSCYENLSPALKTQCQLGTGLCESCFDDDCNSNIYPRDRQFCYQCESAECNANTLASTVCESYSSTDKCITVVKNGEPAEFTCLSSFNRTKSCENIKSCVVSECSDNGCNQPTQFEKSTSCVQCDTNSDVKCSTAPNMVGSVPCKQSVDKCYTMLQDGKVFRGCLGDLNGAQQTYCQNNCDLCDSAAGCNSLIYPPNRLYCHQCDSRVNSSCSQSTSAVPSMCLNYNTDNKCIALLTNEGIYIRTCASDVEAICKDTKVCLACDKYGCNNEKIDDTPVTDTPGTDTPGTDTPGTNTPGTDTPGTDTPGTNTPGTDTPITDTPGTNTPGTDTPGTDTPGTDTPGTDTPGTNTPGTDTPGTGTPGTDKPNGDGGGSVKLSVSTIMVVVFTIFFLILNVN